MAGFGIWDEVGKPFGLDLSGQGGIDQANAANTARYRKALGESRHLEGLLGQQYGIAGNYLNTALGSINKGYGQARQGLQFAGQSAKQGIQDRGQQQLAGSQQSLASRGLYNTTAFDAAQRGIHADTSRALSSVDESIGQMLAQLNVNRGQAQAGAYGALSGLAQNQYGSLANLYQNRINTISSRNDIANPGVVQQFAGLLGSFMGAGGGGGGGGYSLGGSNLDAGERYRAGGGKVQ